MSTKTHGRGSSVESEGIDNYLDLQSVGAPIPVIGDAASTKRGEDDIPQSRLSMT
jgi:hypothetical protein